MIGVLSKDSETRAVEEFFQLFKTPWEFYAPQRSYDFVMATTEEVPRDLNVKALAIYSSKKTRFDDENSSVVRAGQTGMSLDWSGAELPVYGEVRAFAATEGAFLKLKGSAQAAGVRTGHSQRQTLRIGYDLFQEVFFLLSQGQPPENARIPTLELHIALLRECMMAAGVRFVEIPPAPAGYDFMACLTHDVDFVGIRQHKFDHTMWGFLYRALVGSTTDAIKGRLAWRKLAQNWKAALSLPLVQLGLLPDFWLEFDRYRQIEKGLGSTFFFIPYKGVAGEQVTGQAPKRRAVQYDFAEMSEQVRDLAENGCEIGLHGIDAWKNSEKGRKEMERIRELAGPSAVGARIHWLYFAESSPKNLEEAGCSYDSTCGYNDAAGFRAGTAQAFCPPAAKNLLELPLTIQDTALFYPSRMNLAPARAMERCLDVLRSAETYGGTVTVNWHTRSLSPERLWGEFYAELLKQMQSRRVWFATGAEIVRWFRRRRALRFDSVKFDENGVQMKLTGAKLNGQPSFVLRVYDPKTVSAGTATLPVSRPAYRDTRWMGETELRIAS